MAVLTGQAGSVKLAANAILEMDSWTVTFGPNLVNSHSFGDSWEEKTATIKRWTGTATGRFDDTDTTGALALNTDALNGDQAADVRFYVDDTNYWAGAAYVEVSASASVDGLVEATFTFTGTGALTYT